jgi:hypothetical protein
MTKYQFTGDYESNVTLPDGSVLLVDPGDVVDLTDFGTDGPGPVWAATKSPVTVKPAVEPVPAPAPPPPVEPADVAAWLAAHPEEIKP